MSVGAAHQAPSITHLLDDDAGALLRDVRDGLSRPLKELKPKYFYDARGAELFDRICRLPEYYPTRCERAILVARAAEIASMTGASELLELGPGKASKTRILLDALAACGTLRRYVPVDVAEASTEAVATELADAYPGLQVDCVIADFEHQMAELPEGEGPRLVAFLGGTIGNFVGASRAALLDAVASLLDSGDHLLLGADLVKEPALIEAAYDDAAGVTAEFNRNILRVINRELGASFDVDLFEHVAFYDREREWIEMRLRARTAHSVSVTGIERPVSFESGEEIRTEISAKFTRERLCADLARAGLEPVALFTDSADMFALSLSRPA